MFQCARKSVLLAMSLLTALACTPAAWAQSSAAQVPAPIVPGRNHNMVSGTTLPFGDPFLQRQSESSIAVGSANPSHLMAGANDYRTVDLPGLLDPTQESETGDAWLGVFKSFDGGLTWRSTLYPGCPYNFPACNEPAPVLQPLGFNAASDPTVRAGTHGLFYYSGIAFSRSTASSGVIFVGRFYDYNNREKVTADPIVHLGTVIVDQGKGAPGKGPFQDKPALVPDKARPGDGTCTIPAGPGGIPAAQTIPAGKVYVAYSTFTGGGNGSPTASILSKVSRSLRQACPTRSWSQRPSMDTIFPRRLWPLSSRHLTSLRRDVNSGFSPFPPWRWASTPTEPAACFWPGPKNLRRTRVGTRGW